MANMLTPFGLGSNPLLMMGLGMLGQAGPRSSTMAGGPGPGNAAVGAMQGLQAAQQAQYQLQMMAEQMRQREAAAEQQRLAQNFAVAQAGGSYSEEGLRAMAAQAYPEQAAKQYFAGPDLTTAQRNFAAYEGYTPDQQSAYRDFKRAGAPVTNINMPAPYAAEEADKSAGVQTTVDTLGRLESLLEGTAPGQKKAVDLSGLGGKWAEFMAGSGTSSGLARAVFGELDPYTSEAVQTTKTVQLEAAQALMSGVLTDQDFKLVKDALGLIGGPDTLSAVRRLKGVLTKKEYRRALLRNQQGAGPMPPAAPPPSSPPPAAGQVRFLGYE